MDGGGAGEDTADACLPSPPHFLEDVAHNHVYGARDPLRLS